MDPSAQLDQAYIAVLRQEIPVAHGHGVSADPSRDAAASAAGRRGRACDSRGQPGGNVAGATGAVGDGDGPDAERLGAVRRGSGWRQPTSFVGRDPDVVGVLKQLAAERLVTLTGPGGVGKTRLAAEAAEQLAGGGFAWFTGSASFAALAPVVGAISEVPPRGPRRARPARAVDCQGGAAAGAADPARPALRGPRANGTRC